MVFTAAIGHREKGRAANGRSPRPGKYPQGEDVIAEGSMSWAGTGFIGAKRAEPVSKSPRRETRQSQAAVNNMSITRSQNPSTINPHSSMRD